MTKDTTRPGDMTSSDVRRVGDYVLESFSDLRERLYIIERRLNAIESAAQQGR